MRPKIAVDFDGVLADTAPVKIKWIKDRFGVTLAESSASRSTLVSLVGISAYQQMQSEVGYQDTLAAEAFAGALEALQEISQRFDVVVLTARPVDKIPWVENWLVARGFSGVVGPVFSSYGKSKLENARLCGSTFLIDDDQRHFEVSPEVRFILFGEQGMTVPIAGICRARHWCDVRKLFLGPH